MSGLSQVIVSSPHEADFAGKCLANGPFVAFWSSAWPSRIPPRLDRSLNPIPARPSLCYSVSQIMR